MIYDRHKEIGRELDSGAEKPGLCHADDGERMLAEKHRATQHVAITMKVILPICVAEHYVRHAVWAVFVRGVKQAT